jgi:predicted 3-demethylubiquinone-9 3-methyltransferase (glyoxalase superfamily)
LLTDPNTAKSKRAFQAMLQMKKLDIEGLQRAFAG